MNSRFYKTALHVLLIFGFFIALFALPPAIPARAAGRCYVNAAASGGNSGASWANAYTSLQSAIASSCTEIWVAAGTYKPHVSDRNVSFTLESGTAIYGGFAGIETKRNQRNFAANATILSGDLNGNDNANVNSNEPTRSENSYHVVIGSGTDQTAILDGFTITGGNANGGSCPSGCGSGMYNLSGSPTLTNLIYNGNSSWLAGGGIYDENSNPTLTNVTISANYGDAQGGGMDNNASNPILTNVTFSDNYSSGGSGGGGGMDNNASNPILTNVTFNGNIAAYGGGIYNASSNPTLTNVTFNGNFAATGTGGGFYNFSGSPILINVIFANNNHGDCILFNGSTINASSKNNLIMSTGSNACGLTNGINGNIIGADPKLGSITGSPAYFPIFPNSPAINAGTNSGCPTTSQNGLARPQVAICDIGSYEAPDYSNPILYAKPGATGTGTCLSWANACTLQTAISASTSGKEIWVMAGTHKPDASDRAISFQLKNGVAVYGGFAGTETLLSQRDPAAHVTILSGDLNGNDNANVTKGEPTRSENSYHVVNGSGADQTAILDGFTITSGNANNSGSCPAGCGGGMVNISGSPTLTNLTFSANTASFGGGMSNDASSNPILTNVTFSGNSAGYGGGMENDASSPVLTNVTFSGNSASVSGGGGGMDNTSGNPTLINVIIANSTNGDCILYLYGGATINASSKNNLIMSTGANACGLTNGVNGNIIGADPKLGGLIGSPAYFPIFPGSPAINAGANSSCPASSQNGLARPQVFLCDIGSYEAPDYSNAILYAKPGATGTGTCLSWANACTLQTAMSAATSGNDIWVMQGTHKPHASYRAVSFVLKSGVQIYGGFTGTETSLSQRNSVNNVTVLSGDLLGNDNGFANNGENSFHVVYADGVDDTAVLDGFTISGGNASGLFGGGMYNSNGNPTLRNLIFYGNAANFGGGMYNGSGSPSLTNVAFNQNTSGNEGGGMYNFDSSLTLINSTFSLNSSSDGGGMYNEGGGPSLTNVTFSGNSATFSGGGMVNVASDTNIINTTISGNSAANGGGMYNLNSSPTLKNVIIANSVSGGDCVNESGSVNAASSNNLIESTGSNACDLANGSNGNIIGSDPNLGTLTGSPAYFPLNAGSPAIDTGVNTGCPAADQRGMKRPQGVKCDIGAFESIATTTFKSSGPNDGWILESTETSGIGGSMNNAATTFNLGDNATDKQYRSILYFNTASLPDNAVITKVVLKLKHNGIVGGGNPIADFQGIFVDLKKGLFGAATLQLTDFNAAGNKTLGPASPTIASGWYSISLTAGKAQINKVAATQVRLRFKLDDNNNNLANFLKIYSGNAPIASRPQLIITYYTP